MIDTNQYMYEVHETGDTRNLQERKYQKQNIMPR
jgi:hypothetical protein